MNKAAPNPFHGLFLGSSLGVMFLAFSYLRLIGDSQSMLFEHAAFKAVFEGPVLGTRLATLVGWFAATQILLHVILGIGCWLMARATLIAFPTTSTSQRAFTALWFVVTVGWLLAWNAGHYPHSALGSPYKDAARNVLLSVPVHTWITGFFLAAVGSVIIVASLRRFRAMPFVRARGTAIWAVVALPVVACAAAWPEGKVAPPPANKPNIIFLGIDSLRHDEMQMSGQTSHTRNLDAFLDGAVRLENAYTPLARTFPAWVAVLTGRRPETTGAILNLLPDRVMNRGPTLPEILRADGYHTAYAIDEVRFSNIDRSYGFDDVETPGIGSADFILGALSDTPLINAIVNSRLGKWLLPYCHANRANAHNYDPQSFVTRVREDIEYRSPMFLAAHLTLPHWPYRWRDSESYVMNADERRPRFYIEAVRRADQQFGDILASLEARGMLENAIVVAFSDHGETFGAVQDTLTPDGNTTVFDIGAKPAWGHGTSVLTPHQYRVFLAMRAYGPAQQHLGKASGTTSIPASLEDLTPTIIDMLDLPSQKVDGLSLLPELQANAGSSERLAHRIRFTETEFNPLNLVKLAGDADAVNASSLADAATYYRVDGETDRLEMKTQFLETLRRNRQYAALGWTQMIGMFPRPLERSYEFLVVDLSGGEPRHVQSQADLQADAEVGALWNELCARHAGLIDAGTQTVRCNPPQVTAQQQQ